MATSLAGRVFAAASGLLNRTPVLKHAVKERVLDVVARAHVQQGAYLRWRKAHFPAAGSEGAGAADAQMGSQPLIAIRFPEAPTAAATAALGAQSYPGWVVGGDTAADWVAFLSDDGAQLWPHALAEIVRTINAQPSLEAVYTDEEDVAFRPLFKPDWNPELAESVDLLGGLVVVKAELAAVLSQGGHDRTLRLLETGARVGHLPSVLVTVRPPAADPQAVASHFARVGGVPPEVRATDDPSIVQVSPTLVGQPKVSIVIPSRNSLDIVKRCLESVVALSSYDNYELILVDTGSDDPAVWDYYEDFGTRRKDFVVLPFPEQPFSYSRSCNAGAAQATGEVLIFLNNDTEVMTPDWIERLAAEAQRPEVGGVGALLLFPKRRRIQHAGVGLGFGPVAANLLSGVAVRAEMTRTQRLLAFARRESTALTGACLAVRSEAFAASGGFDPALRITFNDVDLCCRLQAQGLRNVYRPDVRLVHHESVSVNKLLKGRRDWDEVAASLDLMEARWGSVIAADPLVSPWLLRTDARCRFDPEATAERSLNGG